LNKYSTYDYVSCDINITHKKTGLTFLPTLQTQYNNIIRRPSKHYCQIFCICSRHTSCSTPIRHFAAITMYKYQ